MCRNMLTRRITRALWFDTLRLVLLPPKPDTNHSALKAETTVMRTTETRL
jgi:hypothetical protein